MCVWWVTHRHGGSCSMESLRALCLALSCSQSTLCRLLLSWSHMMWATTGYWWPRTCYILHAICAQWPGGHNDSDETLHQQHFELDCGRKLKLNPRKTEFLLVQWVPTSWKPMGGLTCTFMMGQSLWLLTQWPIWALFLTSTWLWTAASTPSVPSVTTTWSASAPYTGAWQWMRVTGAVRYLTVDGCVLLVLSTLDYCNALLAGQPWAQTARPQHSQNWAAHLVMHLLRHSHITPALTNLHWPPVQDHINFEVMMYVYKTLSTLWTYCNWNSGTLICSNCIATSIFLTQDQPRTLGGTALCTRCCLCGMLLSLCKVHSLRVFHRGLKTHLSKLRHGWICGDVFTLICGLVTVQSTPKLCHRISSQHLLL